MRHADTLKIILLGLLLALGSPAAQSQARDRTIAPPGNSGVSQYLESIPTANGSRPTNTIHPHAGVGGGPGSGGSSAGGTGGDAGGSGGIVPSATLKALAAKGPDGAAAAGLADATGPNSRRSGQEPRSSSQGSSGSSPASAVVKALTGSAGGRGLGVLLPVMLAVAAGMVAAGLILRRRRST